MKNRKIWTKESYENYPVIIDANRELYCDQKILEEIKRQFDYAEKNKKRIFFMRYDIRLPVKLKAPCNNKLICDFQANFVKNLQRHGLKPQYLLVREQSREKHQHYHGVLFLDGHETQCIAKHIATGERLLDSAFDLPPKENGYGLIDDCTKSRNGEKQINGVMLRHDDPDYETKKADCFRRASYLAKINTKGNTPEGQREIFSSRIPKD